MSEYDELTSENAFQVIWDNIIQTVINDYKSKRVYTSVNDNAYDLIKNNYSYFRNHCRTNYMKDANDLLDRHKVCACMIYSIVKASVINEDVLKEDKSFCTINEDLALTTGLSLLRAFIESAIRTEITDENHKINLLQKFNDGLKYPPTRHGNYRENFLAELHFTKVENNYNVLSLAHTLFLLELYTRFCDK